MRLLLFIWTIIIFAFTCVKDVYGLLNGEIEFAFAKTPHWTNLFTLYSIDDISKIEFVGHFFLFFILTGLLVSVCNRISNAVVIGLLYAIATELLQPLFGRGAEGADLLANIIAIIAFAILYGVVKIEFEKGRRKVYKQENENAQDLL